MLHWIFRFLLKLICLQIQFYRIQQHLLLWLRILSHRLQQTLHNKNKRAKDLFTMIQTLIRDSNFYHFKECNIHSKVNNNRIFFHLIILEIILNIINLSSYSNSNRFHSYQIRNKISYKIKLNNNLHQPFNQKKCSWLRKVKILMKNQREGKKKSKGM